jgi:hypothetical protein
LMVFMGPCAYDKKVVGVFVFRAPLQMENLHRVSRLATRDSPGVSML